MKQLLIMLVMAALAQANTALAQAVSELACDDFKPTPAAVERFPDLKGACEAIVERDGELYAKFTVVVRRATNRTVTLYLPATDHTFTITPEASSVVLAGQKVRIRDLQRGQEMHVYLATSEFSKPDIEEVVILSDVDLLVAMPAAPAAMLPKTASLLPALGLGGLVFLALAWGLRRQRVSQPGGTAAGIAVLALALGLGAPDSMAEHHEAVKPARITSGLIRTGAIVESVDYETRELKLIDATGRRFTTKVSEDVVNFSQIKPRDRIITEYLESVAIVVAPAGTPAADQSVVEVAGEGQKPAIAMSETTVVVATVASLNLASRRAVLRFEDGSTRKIKVRDGVPLDLVKVGDEVQFHVTNSMAVSVQKVGAM